MFADAHVGLSPQQVEASPFAFRRPFSKGAIFADEVGLGKAIESGLLFVLGHWFRSESSAYSRFASTDRTRPPPHPEGGRGRRDSGPTGATPDASEVGGRLEPEYAQVMRRPTRRRPLSEAAA